METWRWKIGSVDRADRGGWFHSCFIKVLISRVGADALERTGLELENPNLEDALNSYTSTIEAYWW